MDNASDALMIAGTVLISLIIISALVFMFSKITDYKKTEEGVDSEEQITDFNKGYTSFEKDLYGSELLSLINKAVDYNEKNESEGYVPITIKFNLKNGTGNNNSSSLIRSGTYSIDRETSNPVAKALLQEITDIKKKYKGDKYLERLISLYDKYNNSTGKTRDDAEYEIKMILKDIGVGENKYNDSTVKKEINKYSEYLEFKRKKFEWKKTLVDGEQPGSTRRATNGRIVQMEYEEII